MKNIVRIMVVLFLVAILSGCYLVLPHDQNVQMSTYSLQVFVICSDTAHGFQWYLDNELMEDKAGNSFEYLPTHEQIGDHTLVVSFKDGELPAYHTWYIHVY